MEIKMILDSLYFCHRRFEVVSSLHYLVIVQRILLSIKGGMMGVFRNKTISGTLVTLSVGIIFLGFQNCAKGGFSATESETVIVDAECNVSTGCESAASTESALKVLNKSSLYNFVAGDQKTCEASILNRLGKAGRKFGACSIGGGCGISCGLPSDSCRSANPTLWGSCIDIKASHRTADRNNPPLPPPQPISPQPLSPPPPLPPVPKIALYNFVAGDQKTCEASIFNRLGKEGSCSIGGGCGVSCGLPSDSCRSANPTLWGSCISVQL